MRVISELIDCWTPTPNHSRHRATLYDGGQKGSPSHLFGGMSICVAKRRWNLKRQIINIVQFTKIVNRWRYLNLVVHNLKATISSSNDVDG
jgi:hypothetical protein